MVKSRFDPIANSIKVCFMCLANPIGLQTLSRIIYLFCFVLWGGGASFPNIWSAFGDEKFDPVPKAEALTTKVCRPEFGFSYEHL